MSKTIMIRCPQCDKRLNVRSEYQGKKAACKHCEAVFTIAIPESETTENTSEAQVQTSNDRLLASALKEMTVLRNKVVASENRAEELERLCQQLKDSEAQAKLELETQISEARTLERTFRGESLQHIQTLESEQNRLLAEWNASLEQISVTRTQLDEKRIRVDQLEAALATEQQLQRDLFSELSRCKTELSDSQAKTNEVSEKAQSLVKDLEAARLERNAQELANQDLQSQLQAIQESAKTATDRDRVSNENELVSLREELQVAKAQLEELKQIVEQSRASELATKSHLYRLGIHLPG